MSLSLQWMTRRDNQFPATLAYRIISLEGGVYDGMVAWILTYNLCLVSQSQTCIGELHTLGSLLEGWIIGISCWSKRKWAISFNKCSSPVCGRTDSSFSLGHNQSRLLNHLDAINLDIFPRTQLLLFLVSFHPPSPRHTNFITTPLDLRLRLIKEVGRACSWLCSCK